MTWKYAWDPCANQPRSPYVGFHDMELPVKATEMVGDRKQYMYCTSCEAYLWGCYTIKEEPW